MWWVYSLLLVLGESSILRSRLTPSLLTSRRLFHTFRPEYVHLPIRLLSGTEQIVTVGPDLTIGQLEREIAFAFNYYRVMDRISIEFENLNFHPSRPYVLDYVLENPGLVGVVRPTVLVDFHQNPFLYHMIERTPRGAFITPRQRPTGDGERKNQANPEPKKQSSSGTHRPTKNESNKKNSSTEDQKPGKGSNTDKKKKRK